MFLPAYSIYSFLTVLVASAQTSLEPWQDLVEAFALGNFFLLLLELISPHEDQRSLFFAGMDLPTPKDTLLPFGNKKKKNSAKPKKPVDPLVWYRIKWIGIFQYVLSSIFVGIVTDITVATGSYCSLSYNPKFAHFWMGIIAYISQTICLTAVILFFMACRKGLATHRPLAKIVAFKVVIFFIWASGIIFTILQMAGVMKPTATLTYADVKVGIPTLAELLFMVPVSIFFHYAYSWRFYQVGGRHYLESGQPNVPGYKPSYQGGFLGYRAYLIAMNPLETIQAIIFAFKLYMPSSRHYVRNRVNGPDGHKYVESLHNKDSNNSAVSTNNRPGFEPLRYEGQGNDYALQSEYPTTASDRVQPNAYMAVPNPTAQEPVGIGYASDGYGRTGRDISPPGRSHSRSPSREQFLPPTIGQPTTYGPLQDRERY